MPINQLYDTWKMRIMELRPESTDHSNSSVCVADNRNLSESFGVYE